MGKDDVGSLAGSAPSEGQNIPGAARDKSGSIGASFATRDAGESLLHVVGRHFARVETCVDVVLGAMGYGTEREEL